MAQLFCSGNETKTRSHSPPTMQQTQTDALISTALKQLSLEEREQTYYEMHGVAESTIEETPEFVAQKLKELRQEIVRMSVTSNLPTRAIQLAESQKPAFVFNRKMYMRFLRGVEYRADRAATRMIRYYDWKLQLFGESKLCKEIAIEDLNEEDLSVLRKGYFQRLPERDRAGRPVCVAILSNQKFPSPECLGRVLWYTYQQRQEEADESTAVGIIIYLADPSLESMDPQITGMYTRASDSTSGRTVAYHHCVSDSSSLLFRAFLNLVVKPLENANKAKVKIHHGTHTEWMYALMTYGISHHLIPVSDDGKIKTKNHLEFLQLRRAREQFCRAGRLHMVDVPLNSDVLLGRGKPIQQHAGNLRLQAIVDEYVVEYHQLTKKEEKTAMASKVVHMVKAAGTRFLSKENFIWMEVGDDIAREKVSGLCRTRYRAGFGRPPTTLDNRAKVARPAVTMDDSLGNSDHTKRVKI